MTPEEIKRFNEADKVVHPATKEWHYATLTEAGFQIVEERNVGFVRSYTYVHPATGHRIVARTGVSADYWQCSTCEKFGYWSDLKKHVAVLPQ